MDIARQYDIRLREHLALQGEVEHTTAAFHLTEINQMVLNAVVTAHTVKRANTLKAGGPDPKKAKAAPPADAQPADKDPKGKGKGKGKDRKGKGKDQKGDTPQYQPQWPSQWQPPNPGWGQGWQSTRNVETIIPDFVR